MKSKNKLVCGLIAFWPFVLFVLVVNIWGLISWNISYYEVINGALVRDAELHGWIFVGKFINIITAAILAVLALGYSWLWCEGNYRECIGLPRERNEEEREETK